MNTAEGINKNLNKDTKKALRDAAGSDIKIEF